MEELKTKQVDHTYGSGLPEKVCISLYTRNIYIICTIGNIFILQPGKNNNHILIIITLNCILDEEN